MTIRDRSCQRRNRFRPNLAVFFAFLVFGLFDTAESVKAQGVPQAAIAIRRVEGRLGSAAAQRLDHHLRQSGWLRVVTSPNGAYQAEMELASGNKLIGRLLSPNGKELFERKYDRSDLDHDIRQYSDDIVLSLSKRPGIATSQIAFVSNKNGRREIYVCDYDGRNIRQITRDGRNNVLPAISPRGERLLHTTHAPGYADLLMIDLSGGRPSPLVRQSGAKTEAEFSADGERVAYTLTVNGNSDLYTVDADGGKPKRLIASQAHEAMPTWSPDRKQIVYSSNGSGAPQLYIISAKGGKPQLLPTGHADCRKPAWSPDGRSIAFVSGGSQPAVTIYDVNSRRSRVLSAGNDPAWGADSRHVVFAYRGTIYRTDTMTARSQSIVSGHGAATEPTWTR